MRMCRMLVCQLCHWQWRPASGSLIRCDRFSQFQMPNTADWLYLVDLVLTSDHFSALKTSKQHQHVHILHVVSDKKKNNIQPNAFLRNDSIPSSSPTVSTLRYTTQFFSSTSHFSLHPFVLHPPSCTLSLGVENPLITTWNLPPHPFSQEEFLTPLQLLSALPQLYSST